MLVFQYNIFKQRLLKERVTTPTTTVYKCGPLIDLCRGPHVRHTGKVKAMMITKVGSLILSCVALFHAVVGLQHTKGPLIP